MREGGLCARRRAVAIATNFPPMLITCPFRPTACDAIIYSWRTIDPITGALAGVSVWSRSNRRTVPGEAKCSRAKRKRKEKGQAARPAQAYQHHGFDLGITPRASPSTDLGWVLHVGQTPHLVGRIQEHESISIKCWSCALVWLVCTRRGAIVYCVCGRLWQRGGPVRAFALASFFPRSCVRRLWARACSCARPAHGDGEGAP